MFILKGNRKSLIGEEELLENCRVCNASFSLSVRVFQRYTHIFYIPIFPYKKETETYCVICKTILDDKVLDSNVIDKAKQTKKKQSAPLWTYIGSIVFIIFTIYVLISGEEDKKEAISYIRKPKFGDYYIFKEGYKLKRYYKLVFVSGDTLGFNKNKSAENKSWKFIKSKKLEYDSMVVKFTKRDLLLLLQKNKIRINTDSLR